VRRIPYIPYHERVLGERPDGAEDRYTMGIRLAVTNPRALVRVAANESPLTLVARTGSARDAGFAAAACG